MYFRKSLVLWRIYHSFKVSISHDSFILNQDDSSGIFQKLQLVCDQNYCLFPFID